MDKLWENHSKINIKLTNFPKNCIHNLIFGRIYSIIEVSRVLKNIQKDYGTFYNYLRQFTGDKVIYETDKTTNELSDKISKDLKRKGMKFVGSTIIYSYLQAIGVIYSHDKECFMYKNF